MIGNSMLIIIIIIGDLCFNVFFFGCGSLLMSSTNYYSITARCVYTCLALKAYLNQVIGNFSVYL